MTGKQIKDILSLERFDIKGLDAMVRFNGGQTTTPIVAVELDKDAGVIYFDVTAEYGNGAEKDEEPAGKLWPFIEND